MDSVTIKSELENFKEQTWMNYARVKTKHKDLTDDHLINIIYHIQHLDWFDKNQIRLFIELANSRGLTQMDLDRAQIPHRNKDGNLVMMSYNYENWGQIVPA